MKKFLAAVPAMLIAVSAQASYLWWEVNSNDPDTDMSAVSDWIGDGANPWTVAQVWAVSDTDASDKSMVGSAEAANQNNPIVSWGGQINLSSFDGYKNGYSYYIELVNTSGGGSSVVGYSTPKTAYVDLAGSITETLDDVPKVSVWHGGSSYKAAPEPTSAMLMLLGVAGLALRRKQRKLA